MKGKPIKVEPLPKDPWKRLQIEFNLSDDEIHRLKLMFLRKGCCGEEDWVDWGNIRAYLVNDL